MNQNTILALAITAATTTFSAQADIITAQFAGTVQEQSGTAFAVNAPVSGSFTYDTSTSQYLGFSMGGLDVAPGFASSATITPDQYSALYVAQLSPVLPGVVVNSTFTLDLEGVNKWPGFNAVALLTNSAALSSNLDPAFSRFGFYTANGDGTDIRSMSASLVSLAVTAVPEPASWALMLAGVAALGTRAWRRKG